MPARAGVAYIDILPRFSKFTAGLQAGMNRVGRRLETVGHSLSRTLALPLAAIGAASVKLSVDFEESLDKIIGLVGIAAEDVHKMGEEILALSPKVGKGPKELADALFFITSAGFRGAQAMSVLAAAARASAAGLGETRIIADAVTSAVNAYGIKNLSAAQATDVLVAAVREGKVAADALAPAIGRVIPIASNAGVSFNEVGAAIASMTRTGLNAQEAVTALRGFLVLLLKPAKQSREALKELGLTQQDVAQITQRFDLSLAKGGLSVDRLRKIVSEKGLFEGMIALKTALGGNFDALGQVIPNVRALTGFLSIAGANAKENAKIFENLADATGSTDRAFAAASKTARFKFNQALASLQSAGVQLGAQLLPIIKDIVDVFAGLVKRFSELSPGVKKLVARFVGFFAVLGPGLFLLSKLFRTFGSLIGVFRVVVTRLAAVTAATKAATVAAGGQASAAGAAQTSTLGWIATLVKAHPAAALAAVAVAGIATAMIILMRRSDPVAARIGEIRDSTVKLRRAETDLATRQKDVADAQRIVNKLRRDGKADTDEYRDAVHKLENAEAERERAVRAAAEAERNQRAAIRESIQSIGTLLRSLDVGATLGAALAPVGEIFNVEQLQRFKSNLDVLIQTAKRSGLSIEQIQDAVDDLHLPAEQARLFHQQLEIAWQNTDLLTDATLSLSKALGTKLRAAFSDKALRTQLDVMDDAVESFGKLAGSSDVVSEKLKETVKVLAENVLWETRTAAAQGKHVDSNSLLLTGLRNLRVRYPELARQIDIYIGKVEDTVLAQSKQRQSAALLAGVLNRIKNLPPTIVKTIESRLRGLIDGSFTDFRKIEERLKAIKNLSPTIRKEIIAKLKTQIEVQLRIRQIAFETKTGNEPRQHGGPVRAGQSYLVGEKGPELVRFTRPGHVYSNEQSMAALAGGGDTFNVVINNPKPERLELSLPAALRRAELMRARG